MKVGINSNVFLSLQRTEIAVLPEMGLSVEIRFVALWNPSAGVLQSLWCRGELPLGAEGLGNQGEGLGWLGQAHIPPGLL